MRMKILFTLILTCFSCFIVIAQDSKNNVDQYFDEGEVSSLKNSFKYNVASLYNGDVHFNYERVIGSFFSIELGAGYLLPYYNHNAYYAASQNDFTFSPQGGYSWSVMPRAYFNYNAPFAIYFGVKYRKRNYTLENGSSKMVQYAMIAGYQFLVNDRICIDLNYGAGFDLYTGPREMLEEDVEYIESEKEKMLVMPINISVGYIF